MPTISQTPGKPNRLGEATRAKIIDAAIAVLAENGFADFTMQAVASRADVVYGNLTHHCPSRDKLIEAMLEAILERYGARFDAFAASLDNTDASQVRKLVTWLIDDSVDPETAPVFLELWAMSTHNPMVADGLAALYDGAVESCMRSLGVLPQSPKARRLRDTLYLLGTVLEGSSSIFYNRTRSGEIYEGFRREAIEILVTVLEQRLAEAKDETP
ncbi:TetR family transcriptional regulator [uncultured Hyphomicrobium sp.]|uniref:TetR/AcrR family transcriptional regulator n=1 Tax=uncultured Hyphomicrobium sp. TaxID=194373 RepID=UPI0025CF5279|nr:TetR family transcriptional regulator [uncultured Hyphomicrobium sp.]